MRTTTRWGWKVPARSSLQRAIPQIKGGTHTDLSSSMDCCSHVSLASFLQVIYWRKVALRSGALMTTRRCVSIRSGEGATDDPLGSSDGGGVHVMKKDEMHSVPSLDVFAQSRVSNYLQRIYGNGQESTRSVTSLFRVSHGAQGALIMTELTLPVDVLDSGHVRRRELRAVGYAADAKSSMVVCCMHAELLLDAVGVPLFSSERRQRQRAEQAEKAGRYAPRPGDAPLDLAHVQLPRPMQFETGGEAARSSSKPSPVLPSYQPNYTPQKRRHQDFTHRRGGDPFLRGVAGEMAHLQATIMQHNQSGMEEENDEWDGVINESEVAILQPRDAIEIGQHLNYRRYAVDGVSATSSQLPGVGRSVLAFNSSKPVRTPCVVGAADESEDGLFNLVEGDGMDWEIEDKLPNAPCLRDPHAISRVSEYFERSQGCSFLDCVRATILEESTPVYNQETRRWSQDSVRWYTTSAVLPDYEALNLTAVGKATSLEASQQLCAMHAELLLNYLGVPLYSDYHKQTRHYDACLRYGRHIAPEPQQLTQGDMHSLPKPLKEWYYRGKRRLRGAPLSTVEKLLALNRRVISEMRQHLMEVNLHGQDLYDELFDVAVTCLRVFMVAQKHPYEGAFFNFVYQQDTQYRCSVYLPLPERYGVRGGCAIATTPKRARQYCSLHAVDVLCALDFIPDVCWENAGWRRMMELRKELNLFLPCSYPTKFSSSKTLPRASPHPLLRSPPGYREVPGGSSSVIPSHEDLWNVLLMDAGDFDVVPDLSLLSATVNDAYSILRQLFLTYVRYAAGWNEVSAWRHIKHYCGMQHLGGSRRMPANNFWMDLPIDTSRYGRRVALARCVTRRGAERHLMVHIFRILRALDLAPWDEQTMTQRDLLQKVYLGNAASMQKELNMWKALCKHALDLDNRNLKGGIPGKASSPATVTTQPSLFTHGEGVQEAEVISCVTETSATDDAPRDFRRVLSPNPVMSEELARRTFT